MIESQINIHGASYGAAYHGVVADAEEAHHLYVSRYAGGTGKLRVGVHAAEGVGHAVGYYLSFL